MTAPNPSLLASKRRSKVFGEGVCLFLVKTGFGLLFYVRVKGNNKKQWLLFWGYLPSPTCLVITMVQSELVFPLVYYGRERKRRGR